MRDATQHGDVCGQFDMAGSVIIGSDDCLFVNVYTRSLSNSPGDTRLQRRPVLVWIHGGGFVSGSGDDKMYGPDYFMRKDVVLVSLNYRVGVLGELLIFLFSFLILNISFYRVFEKRTNCVVTFCLDMCAGKDNGEKECG